MLPVHFKKDNGLRVLLLGAHCDDIEIGCGGTLLRIINEYSIANIVWVVFTANVQRAEEAKQSASYFLRNVNHKLVVIADFKDTLLPQQATEVKSFFEDLKKDIDPDIIFTHYRHDLHQDHRLINELTWNTFRHHLILEYEVPKYDGDLGNPSFFVPLSDELVSRKVEALLNYFPSQANRHWFDQETFRALMRIRGLESASTYAEAFYVRKAIL